MIRPITKFIYFHFVLVDSMINKSKQRFPDGLIVTVAVASLIATELTVVVAIFLFERRKRNSKSKILQRVNIIDHFVFIYYLFS